MFTTGGLGTGRRPSRTFSTGTWIRSGLYLELVLLLVGGGVLEASETDNAWKEGWRLEADGSVASGTLERIKVASSSLIWFVCTR